MNFQENAEKLAKFANWPDAWICDDFWSDIFGANGSSSLTFNGPIELKGTEAPSNGSSAEGGNNLIIIKNGI